MQTFFILYSKGVKFSKPNLITYSTVLERTALKLTMHTTAEAKVGTTELEQKLSTKRKHVCLYPQKVSQMVRLSILLLLELMARK